MILMNTNCDGNIYLGVFDNTKEVKEFNYVTDQEWNNDTKYTVHAVKGELDSWDQKSLDEFVTNGNYQFSLNTILNDLCNRGLMEPGSYLVAVCW